MREDVRMGLDHALHSLRSDMAMSGIERKSAPQDRLKELEQALAAVHQGRTSTPRKSPDEWRRILASLLDTELNDAEIRALTRIRSDKAFLAETKKLLDELYRRKIVLDGKVFQTDARRGVGIGVPVAVASRKVFVLSVLGFRSGSHLTASATLRRTCIAPS